MPPRPLSPRLFRIPLPNTPRCIRHRSSSSLDPSEVQHFNQLASEWWDPHGSSRLLHLMNPLRLRFIESCLRSSPVTEPPDSPASTPEIARSRTNRRFLDVGCGGGILAESLARLPTTESVLAIDPTPGVLDIAKAHMRTDPALKRKLQYRASTIEDVLEEEMFDVVTTMEVVEHVTSPFPFLQSCLTHVRPGGWLIGSTIARHPVSYITTKLIAEDVMRIVPRGTHDWNKYVNAGELEGFFAGEREVVECRVLGCVYVPGFGWREVRGSERVGNYFFGVRKR
ncbi:hexaprenyldihydroxybenzoate methyltransferase [Ascodesmis nigricans]|uniref:Ubiquinone biosynthesis O-methyltransferase, mitochondrial n=1 Tax=Ascodesmis nigricans TaxID=341454 RepID=A0A4S2N4X7_9PEZI|nr:hexaprenyldihydroxybenzoate methyltransferase [Ascodesmis nigricans]